MRDEIFLSKDDIQSGQSNRKISNQSFSGGWKNGNCVFGEISDFHMKNWCLPLNFNISGRCGCL